MRLLSGHRIALVVVSFLAATALLTIARPAFAWTDVLLEMAKQCVLDVSTDYLNIRADLEQIDPTEWSIEQHCAYLNASCWVVYAGLALYTHQTNELPSDLASLAGTEYIPEWPANPYNEWQPIRVLATTDEFSPGDLVWQICPPEFYSGVRRPRAKSCELSIYGPTLEFAELFSPEPLKSNTWATTPLGTVYIFGQYYERSEVTRRKIEENK